MPYINRQQIMGHLGRDPEQKFTTSGIPKTTFSVAVADKWKGKDGQQNEETEWFNVVAWRMDWLSDQLHKGCLVYVEGKTKTREYEGKDGQKHKITELVADRVLPLSRGGREAGEDRPVSAPRSSRQPAHPAPAKYGPDHDGIDDSDVPF